MTLAQREAVIRYVRNCVELNPDCPAISTAREYLVDEGIAFNDAELNDISFNALFGEQDA